MKRNGQKPVFYFSKRNGTVLGKKQAFEKNRGEARRPLKPKVSPADVIEKVESLTAPLCESEGLELVFIEFRRESAGWVLRIYIDRDGGVTLDDCAQVSRQLGDLLDVGLENIWPYHLEVSSPGERRPLGKLSDFVKFSGRLAVIKTREPIEGQKNFRGILKSKNGDSVHLLMEDKTVTIPFQEIVKARLA
jgi:ribosome maturation factor RimP